MASDKEAQQVATSAGGQVKASSVVTTHADGSLERARDRTPRTVNREKYSAPAKLTAELSQSQEESLA